MKTEKPSASVLNGSAMDSIEGFKKEKARFSCLGMGCIAWLIIIAIVTALVILYRKFS